MTAPCACPPLYASTCLPLTSTRPAKYLSEPALLTFSTASRSLRLPSTTHPRPRITYAIYVSQLGCFPCSSPCCVAAPAVSLCRCVAVSLRLLCSTPLVALRLSLLCELHMHIACMCMRKFACASCACVHPCTYCTSFFTRNFLSMGRSCAAGQPSVQMSVLFGETQVVG